MRVMRFTLDWKTVARNVRPKIAWSVARQGRPSRYAERRTAPPLRCSAALPYAHLYLHHSMKYSHPVYDLLMSGRSRECINIKQPRVNVQGEMANTFHGININWN